MYVVCMFSWGHRSTNAWVNRYAWASWAPSSASTIILVFVSLLSLLSWLVVVLSLCIRQTSDCSHCAQTKFFFVFMFVHYDNGVCGKKTLLRIRRQGRTSAPRVPNLGLDRCLCRWLALQRLAENMCFLFTNTGITCDTWCLSQLLARDASVAVVHEREDWLELMHLSNTHTFIHLYMF